MTLLVRLCVKSTLVAVKTTVALIRFSRSQYRYLPGLISSTPSSPLSCNCHCHNRHTRQVVQPPYSHSKARCWVASALLSTTNVAFGVIMTSNMISASTPLAGLGPYTSAASVVKGS